MRMLRAVATKIFFPTSFCKSFRFNLERILFLHPLLGKEPVPSTCIPYACLRLSYTSSQTRLLVLVPGSCAFLCAAVRRVGTNEARRAFQRVCMHVDNTKESSIEVRARTWIGRRTAGFRSKIEMTFCLLRGVLSRAHSYQRDLVRILT